MNIKAIIHERIDWDGTGIAFEFRANANIGPLWVAFPDEYEDIRFGPFHFLNEEYKELFCSRQIDCRSRKFSKKNFRIDDDGKGHFKTRWENLPIGSRESWELTYYALYLPENAIPTKIRIVDLKNPCRDYPKSVFCDKEHRRFVVYVVCQSQSPFFSFEAEIEFCDAPKPKFDTSSYSDPTTVPFSDSLDVWKYSLEESVSSQMEKIFFLPSTYYQMYKYDIKVEQAGIVGENVSVANSTVTTDNVQFKNFEDVFRELEKLHETLKQSPASPERDLATDQVNKAIEAAKNKDAKKIVGYLLAAGPLVLDMLKGIGCDLLSEIIKRRVF